MFKIHTRCVYISPNIPFITQYSKWSINCFFFEKNIWHLEQKNCLGHLLFSRWIERLSLEENGLWQNLQIFVLFKTQVFLLWWSSSWYFLAKDLSQGELHLKVLISILSSAFFFLIFSFFLGSQFGWTSRMWRDKLVTYMKCRHTWHFFRVILIVLSPPAPGLSCLLASPQSCSS